MGATVNIHFLKFLNILIFNIWNIKTKYFYTLFNLSKLFKYVYFEVMESKELTGV